MQARSRWFPWAPLLAAALGSAPAPPAVAAPLQDDAVWHLAERCSEMLPWEDTWEQAARRAVAEKRLVFVLIRLYPSLPDPEIPTAGPLMDADVLELIAARFVPFQYRTGMEAPFREASAYGLSPTAFGNSVLVVDPRGQVLADTFLGDPFALVDFLRAVLAEHPGDSGTPERDPGDEARRLLRRGEWERTATLLAKQSPASIVLRADLLRRQRDGDGARKELAAARRSAPREEQAALALQQGIVSLRTGNDTEARERLAEALALPAPDRVHAEARYWRWMLMRNVGQTGAAQEEWEALRAEFPDEPSTWRCAAQQQSWAFAYGVGEAVAWPPPALLDSLRLASPEDDVTPENAARDAVAFLLRTQREDGSWSHPSELSTPRGLPDALANASDAIAGLGLLEYRDRAGARAAAERSARFLITTQSLWPLDTQALFFMDYSPWRHSYLLRFLLRCAETGVVDREDLEAELESLVQRLQKQQQSGGGWTYFLADKLGTTTAQPSLSFVTGAVLQSLLAADEAGVEVSRDVLDRGTACLERLESPAGTFAYAMLGDVPVPDVGAEEGAAGRGPLCAGILFQQERRDRRTLQRAFELFLRHGRDLGQEHGKSIMHAGAGGQGSHYLMFDYANAALFSRDLPASLRQRCRAELYDRILECRRADGCFVDNPLLGRTAATGLALLALASLR